MSLFHIPNDVFIVFNYIQRHHIFVNPFVKELQDFPNFNKFRIFNFSTNHAYYYFIYSWKYLPSIIKLWHFCHISTIIIYNIYFIFSIVSINYHHDTFAFILWYTKVLCHYSFANLFSLKFYFHLNISKIYLNIYSNRQPWSYKFVMTNIYFMKWVKTCNL